MCIRDRNPLARPYSRCQLTMYCRPDCSTTDAATSVGIPRGTLLSQKTHTFRPIPNRAGAAGGVSTLTKVFENAVWPVSSASRNIYWTPRTINGTSHPCFTVRTFCHSRVPGDNICSIVSYLDSSTPRSTISAASSFTSNLISLEERAKCLNHISTATRSISPDNRHHDGNVEEGT